MSPTTHKLNALASSASKQRWLFAAQALALITVQGHCADAQFQVTPLAHQQCDVHFGRQKDTFNLIPIDTQMHHLRAKIWMSFSK